MWRCCKYGGMVWICMSMLCDVCLCVFVYVCLCMIRFVRVFVYVCTCVCGFLEFFSSEISILYRVDLISSFAHQLLPTTDSCARCNGCEVTTGILKNKNKKNYRNVSLLLLCWWRRSRKKFAHGTLWLAILQQLEVIVYTVFAHGCEWVIVCVRVWVCILKNQSKMNNRKVSAAIAEVNLPMGAALAFSHCLGCMMWVHACVHFLLALMCVCVCVCMRVCSSRMSVQVSVRACVNVCACSYMVEHVFICLRTHTFEVYVVC